MRKILTVLGVLLIIGLVVFLFGPRPDASENITFNPSSLPEGSLSQLDGYLSESESKIKDLREGTAKEIVWANPITKTQTDVALVYIHGFSATKMETAPVSQNVAKALGANLFLTRLAGHGRGGDAMAEPKMSDWLNDTAEAIAIGKLLGKKVILISASTGGTLATWAAANPELSKDIFAMVNISPNYALHGAPTWLLNMPWAETILPALLGSERSFEPINEGHKKGWTHTYPSLAVFPMGALLRTVDSIDPSAIKQPAFFIYSNKDTVVDEEVTKVKISKWGGDTKVMEIDDSIDPYNHVITGDILSPNTTQRVSKAIIEWAKGLK